MVAGTVIDEDVIDRKGKKRGTKKALQPRWKQKIPVAARSMIQAEDVIALGGSPDDVDSADPWKLIEGRGNGVLLLLSAIDGRILAEIPLASPPVLDGTASARGVSRRA